MKPVCYFTAVPLLIWSLMNAALLLIALSNIRWNLLIHFIWVVVGVSAISVSLFAFVRLFFFPSWRRLWWLVPATALWAVDWWMSFLPEFEHIMH